MAHQLQQEHVAHRDNSSLPMGFIIVSVLAFVAGTSATAYFSRSMCCDMEMPGGWKMSMMWMRMPGQTWFTSAVSFLLMWLAMMVAMMMPSALPMCLKIRQQWLSLCSMLCGYFSIWLLAGVGVYALGVQFSMFMMQSELLSQIVPLLSGVSLIAVGMVQFTKWKTMQLTRCRSPFGCAVSCPDDEKSFRVGCKQGFACCTCCATLMTVQLVLGIMNPVVMLVVSIVIAAEKLLPRPEIITRLVGIAAIFAGITMISRWAS
jgi:predicted metal-binding membrane protein